MEGESQNGRHQHPGYYAGKRGADEAVLGIAASTTGQFTIDPAAKSDASKKSDSHVRKHSAIVPLLKS